jgi:hypothetical protein
MTAAIHVQHHPRQWPAWALPAVRSAFGVSPDQSGVLERRFDPRVAERDLFLAMQLFDKVLHVQVEIFSRYNLRTLSTVAISIRFALGRRVRRSSRSS